MKFNDLLLGLLVIAGGVGIYVSALDFTPIPGQAYGAETMPRAIAFLAIGVGLFLSARAVMRAERVPRLSLADPPCPSSMGGSSRLLPIPGVVHSDRCFPLDFYRSMLCSGSTSAAQPVPQCGFPAGGKDELSSALP